jgi:hypothetical protein
MVIGKIGSYLALGLAGAFVLNALIRPGSAAATGGALQETGAGIASIGAGIGDSLRSIGGGSAKLFDPLFTLRDLVFTSDAGTAAGVGPVNQSQVEVRHDGFNRNKNYPVSATVTASSVSDSSRPSGTPSTSPGGGANISSLGSQRASGGGFGAAN